MSLSKKLKPYWQIEFDRLWDKRWIDLTSDEDMKKLFDFIEQLLANQIERKHMKVTKTRLKGLPLPAKKIEDGKEIVPFTKEQYDAVIDYLFTIGMFKEEKGHGNFIVECRSCGELKKTNPTPDRDEICPSCGDKDMMEYEN